MKVGWLVPLLCVAAWAAPLRAQDLRDLDGELSEIEDTLGEVLEQPVTDPTDRSATYVEEQLTEGELFYRVQDYSKASVILTELIDGQPEQYVTADALFLLGDSLFQAGQPLGARTRFREILARGHEPPFQAHLPGTLIRLIEIAIQLRDYDDVDAYFARLGELHSDDAEDVVHYCRGKYLYDRAVSSGESYGIVPTVTDDSTDAQQTVVLDQELLEQARIAFAAVPESSRYRLQARYFIGTIQTLRNQYAQGLQTFASLADLPAETPEQQQVVDLALLGLGRLHYQTDQLERSAAAYQQVSRASRYFDAALYELSWTHIRQGDLMRAEQALATLQAGMPDSRFTLDAALLRGNILLRDGRLRVADDVFRGVATNVESVTADLDAVVARRDDVASHFRRLVRENLDTFDTHAFVPASAQAWTEGGGVMGRALSALSDLSTARRIARENRAIMQRVDGALSAPNPINVFADLRSQAENIIALRNRLARLAAALLTSTSGGQGASEELTRVRSRRRELDELIRRMPTTTEELRKRSDPILADYHVLQRQLADLERALNGMEASIAATVRYAEDTAGTDAATSAEQSTEELAEKRRNIEAYRDQLGALRVQVESTRLHVGVGDASHGNDESLHREHAQLVARERELLKGSGAHLEPRAAAMWLRIDEARDRLEQRQGNIEDVVRKRVLEYRQVWQEEQARLQEHQAHLEELEAEAEELLSAVTYAGFDRIRGRFHDLDLQAGAGTIDVAWAEREEHRLRIEKLTRERSRVLRALDDEFREVRESQEHGEVL